MSKFGDKFKNIFTVDYEDDYDDDFYDDYEEDNAEEAEPVVKKKRVTYTFKNKNYPFNIFRKKQWKKYKKQQGSTNEK